MTRPATMMGTVFTSRWVANAGLRRKVSAVLAIILVILSVWPRPYQASALVAPDDTAAGLTGLFSTASGANLISSLLGGRGTIEGDLLVGRSNTVFSTLAKMLQDQGHYRGVDSDSLQARLHRKIEVESARGSTLRVTIVDHDPNLAKLIVEDYVGVLRERLTVLSRQQAEAKKKIVSQRMDDATELLRHAQETLNAYRAEHNFSTPVIQQAFSQGSLTALQGQLQASEQTLRTLERTVGPENLQLQTSRDKIDILKRQIADLQTRQGSAGSIQSLQKVNPEVAEYMTLLRNEAFAQGRYDIYKRYYESLTVQDVASPLSVTIIDPPTVDPQRRFNAIPIGLLALLIMFALVAELYLGPTPVRAAAGHRDAAEEA